MATSTTEKRPKGRPSRPNQARRVNFHCDADLYAWLEEHANGETITKLLNNIIRERAGL